jgi:ERF superfamily
MQKISAAFVKAQMEFAPALKTSLNPHFKTRYVSLAGCVEAVIDALNRNGIAMMQTTSPSELGVDVETLFIHESGETLKGGRLFVPASKNDAQGFGSALTYARRYSLMATCGIAPEDDDGNAATAKKPAMTDSDYKILLGGIESCKSEPELADMGQVLKTQAANFSGDEIFAKLRAAFLAKKTSIENLTKE